MKGVYMRSIVLLLILTLPQTALFAQVDSESVVRQALAQAIQGGYTSTGEKQLENLADVSSVALTKIIGGRDVKDREIQPILLVVKLSYGNPAGVELLSEREPRTTFFLLHFLDLSTHDAALKGKIAVTRTYVQQQYAKSQEHMRNGLPQNH
jgi:hypothetical protein